jgi:hypothetical protein
MRIFVRKRLLIGFKTGFTNFSQASLKLQTHDPPASTSQTVGIADIYHHTLFLTSVILNKYLTHAHPKWVSCKHDGM